MQFMETVSQPAINKYRRHFSTKSKEKNTTQVVDMYKIF
jgi:hypothetical protein